MIVQRPAQPGGDRVYLDVPYAEKGLAKALGARWDPTVKCWYDPWPPNSGAGAVGRPRRGAGVAAR
jgi:Domain of unknown function (DUF5710)